MYISFKLEFWISAEKSNSLSRFQSEKIKVMPISTQTGMDKGDTDSDVVPIGDNFATVHPMQFLELIRKMLNSGRIGVRWVHPVRRCMSRRPAGVI